MEINDRFDQYLEGLVEGLAHADRRAGLKGFCTGLMLPLATQERGAHCRAP
jgi:SRSO17 transposase